MHAGHSSYPLRVYCRSSNPMSSGNCGEGVPVLAALPFVTAMLRLLDVVDMLAVRDRGASNGTFAALSPGPAGLDADDRLTALSPGFARPAHAVESDPSDSDGTRAASDRGSLCSACAVHMSPSPHVVHT